MKINRFMIEIKDDTTLRQIKTLASCAGIDVATFIECMLNSEPFKKTCEEQYKRVQEALKTIKW